jgi:hypothetical protein
MEAEESLELHGRTLSVHHIIPYSWFGPFETKEDRLEPNELSNLLTLCLPCHLKTEQMVPLVPQVQPEND